MLNSAYTYFTRMAILLALCTTAVAETVTLPNLSAPVDVHIDAQGIPHVYANTWEDAARVLGYLHATDRLAQMEFMRHLAGGTLAEVVGAQAYDNDLRMRQLQIRRSSESWWNSDRVPEDYRNGLLAYTEGVNYRIEERRQQGDLPPLFAFLGHDIEPWNPVDSIVFAKYMAWDQSGTEDDLWFGMMVEKLGIEAVEQLWPLDRPYEIPTVSHPVQRETLPPPRMQPVAGAAESYRTAFASFQNDIRLARGSAFGSNNWAVDGTKTRSGKPMLCNDPHLGFSLPSIWYAQHVNVDGKNVAGVAFPCSPLVVIGHNDRIAWGITNMQADSVDFFVETLHETDPTLYLHRGEWKKIQRIEEEIRVKGEEPRRVTLEYTVHGPIIHRGEKTISLCWNGLGETRDGLALWKLNRAQNLSDALAAFDLIQSPPLNMIYADVDGNIAIHPCGALPKRLPGQGRIPMDGASGKYDWEEFIPRNELPLAVNPPQHFVASANGRPTATGFPHYLGWMWDPSYRTRRIHAMLTEAKDLTIETMKAIQYDAYDLAAAQFLPVFLAALKDDDITDDFAKSLRDAVAQWNFVAAGGTPAPSVWLTWLAHYRNGVWADEWKVRGIEQPGGSWGFCGENEREPMMEVLEYLTREMPESSWFDDQTTPTRETRDDIIRQAFRATVEDLRTRSQNDLARLHWDKVNILHIGSLFEIPTLAREGQPTVGDSFTVNPGGGGGPFGAGASWRMIVDLADPSRSVGVYPGGQSEDPRSPHYEDLMPLWARGDYVALLATADQGRIKQAAARSLRFTP